MDRQTQTTNLVKNSKNNKNDSKKRKIFAIFISILIISLLCAFYNLINPAIIGWLENEFSIVSVNNNLLVHFICVGQGDAVAVNFPNWKLALIDAGPTVKTGDYLAYLNERVVNTKRNKTIDYYILTHADADHIGGALRVIKNYNVENLYMPKVETDSQTYMNLKTYVDENKINVKQYEATVLLEGNCEFEIFELLDYLDANNSCPLIKLTYNNKSFLFTGDLEAKAEKDYVEKYGNKLDCDVLKVGHHGSKYSTCDEFLAVSTPEYAVISSGNMYGHPNEETIERLNNVHANIVRTDTVGSVMFVLGKDYNLDMLTGDYIISGFIFDYRIIILVIDGLLIINMIIVFVKKDKKHKHIEVQVEYI